MNDVYAWGSVQCTLRFVHLEKKESHRKKVKESSQDLNIPKAFSSAKQRPVVNSHVQSGCDLRSSSSSSVASRSFLQHRVSPYHQRRGENTRYDRGSHAVQRLKYLHLTIYLARTLINATDHPHAVVIQHYSPPKCCRFFLLPVLSEFYQNLTTKQTILFTTILFRYTYENPKKTVDSKSAM